MARGKHQSLNSELHAIGDKANFEHFSFEGMNSIFRNSQKCERLLFLFFFFFLVKDVRIPGKTVFFREVFLVPKTANTCG